MSTSAPVFVLLTDFGLDAPSVGQIKAALFSCAPSAPILDLSHGVPPFAVATGAVFPSASRCHFPKGSIFSGVVASGVGGDLWKKP